MVQFFFILSHVSCCQFRQFSIWFLFTQLHIKTLRFWQRIFPQYHLFFNTRNPCWLSEILFVWLVFLRCFVWADTVCHLDCVVWPLEKSQCLSQASSHSWERIRNTSWIFYLLTLSQFDYDKSPVFVRSPRMWQKYQQLKGIETK